MPNKSSETKRFPFLWMPWTARPMRHILSSLLPTIPPQIQGWPTKNQVSKRKAAKGIQFDYFFFSGNEWWFRKSKRNRKPKMMANKVNGKITRGFFVFHISNSWTSIISSARCYFSATNAMVQEDAKKIGEKVRWGSKKRWQMMTWLCI